MRTGILAVLFSLMAICSAFAGEMEEYEFMDGLYSFSAPKGWVVDADPDNTGIVIAPRENSTSMILLSAPNPHHDGDMEEYLGVSLGVLFGVMGGGEIDEVDTEKVGQYDAVTATFDYVIGDEPGAGLAVVLDVQDYMITLVAMSPAKDRKFLRNLVPILESFNIDEDKFEEFEEELDAIGMKMFEQLQSIIGE